MRKLLCFLAIAVLAFVDLSADCREGGPAACPACYLEDWPSPVKFDFASCFRRDRFEWSIAGIDDIPNTLSELEWKDLRMVDIEGKFTYVSCRNYAVRIAGDFAWIYHGHNIDSDYLFDDEQGRFSLARNKAGKGCVYDIDAGVGYRVTSTFARFIAIPLIGYSYHGQFLHMFNGRQIFEVDGIEISVPIRRLNSTYNTRWFGPWIGLEFEARVEACAYVFGSFEWHLLSYRAKGKWNLRTDIGPFKQRAHGTGYLVTLGGKWEIWRNLSIGVTGSFRYFKTRHGDHNVPIHVQGFPTIIVETRFNHAKWKAVTIGGLLSYRF